VLHFDAKAKASCKAAPESGNMAEPCVALTRRGNRIAEWGSGASVWIKHKAQLLGESFRAGICNTGNVSATVNGKLVLSWRGTPTQKDDALKMFPTIQQRMMPGVSLESFADATIASIHDAGMSRDNLRRNAQSIVMLWRLHL
jgi:hypothetical protein